MPPVSVAILSVSSRDRLARSSEKSRLRSLRSMLGSVLSIFTYARPRQETMEPRFSPTMPPVMLWPKIAPEASHARTMPVARLRPAMPPTLRLPETLPLNVQLSIVPWFSPTMPPIFSLSPDGVTVPSTFRFLMTASFCSTPKRPAGETLCVMERLLMVWPLPLNVPPNVGMGSSSSSVSSISLSSTTVLPRDQESSVQECARDRKSSALLMWMAPSPSAKTCVTGRSEMSSRHESASAQKR